jgi:hypothetical protein
MRTEDVAAILLSTLVIMKTLGNQRKEVKAPTFLPTSFPGSDFHLFSQNLPKIDGI